MPLISDTCRFESTETMAGRNASGAEAWTVSGRLERRDQPREYFPAIDGLRGILAVSIIFTHVNRSWFPGAPAVMDIFFVVSGFLITLLLLRNFYHRGQIELKNFWLRRVKRLYPMLLVVVASYLVVGSVLVDQPLGLYIDGVQTLLYVSNWTKLYDYIYPSYFGHTWSLSIEEQFYLLWPIGLALMLRSRLSRTGIVAACLLLVLVTLIWRNYLISEAALWSRIYYALDTRVDAFLLGGVLAMVWQRWHASWYRRHWLALATQILFVGLVIAVITCDPSKTEYFIWQQSAVILLSCGAVIALAGPASTPLVRLLSLHPLRQMGLMCYGIYLWHWPMIWLLVGCFHMRPLPVLCVVLPATVVLAFVSYRYIETPILSSRPRAD